MLLIKRGLLWSSLCRLEHAESLHVEGTYTPHEGFLHRFLVVLSLYSQPLDLCLSFCKSLAVLWKQAAKHGENIDYKFELQHICNIFKV